MFYTEFYIFKHHFVGRRKQLNFASVKIIKTLKKEKLNYFLVQSNTNYEINSEWSI